MKPATPKSIRRKGRAGQSDPILIAQLIEAVLPAELLEDYRGYNVQKLRALANKFEEWSLGLRYAVELSERTMLAPVCAAKDQLTDPELLALAAGWDPRKMANCAARLTGWVAQMNRALGRKQAVIVAHAPANQFQTLN